MIRPRSWIISQNQFAANEFIVRYFWGFGAKMLQCSRLLQCFNAPIGKWNREGIGPFWQWHHAAGCQRINTRFGIAPSQTSTFENFAPSCELQQMEFIMRCLISIRWLQFIFHKHLSAHLTVTCPISPRIAEQLSHRHSAKIYYYY